MAKRITHRTDYFLTITRISDDDGSPVQDGPFYFKDPVEMMKATRWMENCLNITKITFSYKGAFFTTDVSEKKG